MPAARKYKGLFVGFAKRANTHTWARNTARNAQLDGSVTRAEETAPNVLLERIVPAGSRSFRLRTAQCVNLELCRRPTPVRALRVKLVDAALRWQESVTLALVGDTASRGLRVARCASLGGRRITRQRLVHHVLVAALA